MREKAFDWAMFLAAALLVSAVCLFYAPARGAETRGAPVSTRESVGLILDGGIAKIDINTADEALFDSLPGIGEVLAGRIVAYREENGPFSSVEGLLSVHGIGEKTLNAIRGSIAVGKP